MFAMLRFRLGLDQKTKIKCTPDTQTEIRAITENWKNCVYEHKETECFVGDYFTFN